MTTKVENRGVIMNYILPTVSYFLYSIIIFLIILNPFLLLFAFLPDTMSALINFSPIKFIEMFSTRFPDVAFYFVILVIVVQSIIMYFKSIVDKINDTALFNSNDIKMRNGDLKVGEEITITEEKIIEENKHLFFWVVILDDSYRRIDGGLILILKNKKDFDKCLLVQKI